MEKKDSSLRWKDKLLSSSIPLEFEMSKILSSLGVKFSYDYTYTRYDNDIAKEFSIDLKGFSTIKNAKSKRKARFMPLIECKYRSDGKNWVFLPVSSGKHDKFAYKYNAQPLLINGFTIRVIDEFSKIGINHNLISDFEKELECSLKGTEVSVQTGEVFDSDIRHGILRLKYALPYVIKDIIESNLFDDSEDSAPYFIVPILVTNASLRIFKEDFSISLLRESNSLDELSYQVPYLVVKNDSGPDFKSHSKRIFENFSEVCDQSLHLEELAQFIHKQKLKDAYLYDTQEVIDILESSDSQADTRYFSQFFVCNSAHFEEFMTKIIEVLKESIKKK